MPCAGVLCNTMRHGTREATARGREALVVPSDEHRAADGTRIFSQPPTLSSFGNTTTVNERLAAVEFSFFFFF